VVLKIQTPPPELDASVYGAVFRGKRIRRVRYLVAGAVVHRAGVCFVVVGVERMNKHTPGPWLREGCTVYALNGDGFNRFCAQTQDAHTGKNELEANAQLMCAAPDLLEALEAWISYHDDEEDGVDSMLRYAKAIDMTRAAIARAKGDA